MTKEQSPQENSEQTIPSTQQSTTIRVIRKYPHYLIALLILIFGFLYPMPDSSMIPTSYIKIWALTVFCVGCFFPLVLSGISSRNQRRTQTFSVYSILRLISLFPLRSDWGPGLPLHFGSIFSIRHFYLTQQGDI